jgi:hypothetical protein
MVIATLIAELFGIVLLLAVIYFLGRPIIKGAIYFPTTPRGVKNILKLACPAVDFGAPKSTAGQGQKIVDLGSGDGRIVIALAQSGAYAEGYEINPILVWSSRRAIRKANLEGEGAGKAKIFWKSFWRADLSQFDVVIVYGIPYIMKDLQKKMERELRPGTKIISNAFTFPNWTPAAVEGRVRLYILGKR